MDEVLSTDDVVQQYDKNIVLYKGTPVYVCSVDGYSGNTEVTILYLKTGKKETVMFSLKTFSAYRGRMGMVNLSGSAAYVTRIPVRKMGIGLNNSNLHIKAIQADNSISALVVVSTLKKLTHSCYHDVMIGKFPTYEEAKEAALASDTNLIIAFDRQFALSSARAVYYKAEFVGSFLKTSNNPNTIRFNSGWKHLSVLLDNNHEKTVKLSCGQTN